MRESFEGKSKKVKGKSELPLPYGGNIAIYERLLLDGAVLERLQL